MIALLIQAALSAQCTPADYLCNLGHAPTYSEQEAGRMAAQRLQAERELIDRQAATASAAANSQAEAARVLPHQIDGLIAHGRCDAAADAALVGGDAGLAQQVRTRCKR
jgi:hypothetical protein